MVESTCVEVERMPESLSSDVEVAKLLIVELIESVVASRGDWCSCTNVESL